MMVYDISVQHLYGFCYKIGEKTQTKFPSYSCFFIK